uniref:Uncharacterized protein n=1 Tax=Physcomitrium patens TaxID=3218 RepID=A0A2K1L9E3_PHYPA|nr:hypothetical protein PHYPA_001074 [Physcomitrium patens]
MNPITPQHSFSWPLAAASHPNPSCARRSSCSICKHGSRNSVELTPQGIRSGISHLSGVR